MDDRNYVATIGGGSLSLESMGFITFIVFLILKVTNTVDWNWFWIFFPLWLPLAIGAAIYLIVCIAVLIIVAAENRKWK